MKEGDIILTSLSQADGKIKLRPAILLRELPDVYADILVCGVSTQLHLAVEGFDEIIHSDDSNFHSSGLLGSSLIRLGYLAVRPRNTISGSIGAISQERYLRLLKKLCDCLCKRNL